MTDLIPQLLVGKGSFHENKRQWCSKPDLNRHALRQKFLRLSWLPISPFEHINALMYSYICGITGFCDYTKFQKYLISPGYKKPANPFIRTKGFDKTTTSSCLFFQSNKRSCLLLQKPPFLFLRGKKERILISQTVLLFMSAKKVLINQLSSKTYKKLVRKAGLEPARVLTHQVLSLARLPFRHSRIQSLQVS